MTTRAGRLRRRRRLRHHARLPRRADQLVHPPLARPLLGRRRRTRFDTLYTVLETVCRVTAPLLPLTTEEVWRGLTGERSVHLTDWPDADELPADDALVAAMDQVREVCSAGSALRKARGAAQPAAAGHADRRRRRPRARWTGFEAIVADELNVKQVRLLGADDPDAASYGVSQRLTVNARAAGPRLGKDVQTGDQGLEVGGLVGGRGRRGHRRRPGARRRASTPSRPSPARPTTTPATGLLPGGGFVVLDTAVTPELERRGPGPRPGPRRPAGPPRRRPGRLGPDRADRGRLRRRCRPPPAPTTA